MLHRSCRQALFLSTQPLFVDICRFSSNRAPYVEMEVRNSNFRHCSGGFNALRRMLRRCTRVEGGVLPPCVLGDRNEAVARVLRGENEGPLPRLAAAPAPQEPEVREEENKRNKPRRTVAVRQVVVRKEPSEEVVSDVIDAVDGDSDGSDGGVNSVSSFNTSNNMITGGDKKDNDSAEESQPEESEGEGKESEGKDEGQGEGESESVGKDEGQGESEGNIEGESEGAKGGDSEVSQSKGEGEG